jgi:phosphatidylethanolamine/phosphatidyl-N-methylethanolamine N-methyltransferase
MPRPLAESTLFFREYVRNFRTTGAILPSGRQLAAALTRFIDGRHGDVPAPTSRQSKKILEVGPGTGAVTRRILDRMGPEDRLDLVELNEAFVDKLRHRFRTEPAFQTAADRSKVWHCPVEELPGDERYDVVVSGLPLNNFSVSEVERLLTVLTDRLAPCGTLSFFEYIALRRARTLISGRAERTRLQGIGRAMQALFDRCQIRRDAVWLNVPPAWVHHIRG